MLGQWDLQTGLDCHSTRLSSRDLEGQTHKAFLEPQLQGLGAGDVDGQDEATARRSLGGHHLCQTIANGQWSLEVQNAFDRLAWHIS